MDRQRFDQLTLELLEKQYKNERTRKVISRRIKSTGQKVKANEESLTYIAKPKMRACEDCPVISTNNLKIIQLIRNSDGSRYWMKRCDECGKKRLFNPQKNKKTK